VGVETRWLFLHLLLRRVACASRPSGAPSVRRFRLWLGRFGTCRTTSRSSATHIVFVLRFGR
jgi:hypothetical protein